MKPSSSLQDQEQDQEIIRILKGFESLKAEYPPELLAARRSAFLEQIAQRSEVETQEEVAPKDQGVFNLLRIFKSVEAGYPLELLIRRRSAFLRQVALRNRVGFWKALRTSIQSGLSGVTIRMPSLKSMQTSLVLAGIFAAVFVGYLLSGNRIQTFNREPGQEGISQPVLIVTRTSYKGRIICKSGYQPPLCLAGELESTQDLTFQGNGYARPAVAKDTVPGFAGIHRAAYVNDGLYGPGASWISKSPNSWLKIDLGKVTTINTVAFGRDRLGKLNDGDPGQFVISVALSDDVYADGNSNNDNLEYVEVYDSEQTGFNGVVSVSETVQAYFGSRAARFIKITFENAGTAIDEVEAFLLQPPLLADTPTRNLEQVLPRLTSTLKPNNPSLPNNTVTSASTDTPLPTDTPIPAPTNTPRPTRTLTPAPTDTSRPTGTLTPAPSDTPQPTDTLIPAPTELPPLTDTPVLVPGTTASP